MEKKQFLEVLFGLRDIFYYFCYLLADNNFKLVRASFFFSQFSYEIQIFHSALIKSILLATAHDVITEKRNNKIECEEKSILGDVMAVQLSRIIDSRRCN